MPRRERSARWVAGKSKFGNHGSGMATKAIFRRRGADPPKNESGRSGTYDMPLNDKYSAASSGNGTCIAVQSFSIGEVVCQLSSILNMRLLSSSSASTLSTDV